MKRLPGNRVGFKSLVAGAFELAYGSAMESRGDRVFRTLLKDSSILRNRLNDVGTFFEFSQRAWEDVIRDGPFSPAQKKVMSHCIFEAYMEAERTRFWPDLPLSGDPKRNLEVRPIA